MTLLDPSTGGSIQLLSGFEREHRGTDGALGHGVNIQLLILFFT